MARDPRFDSSARPSSEGGKMAKSEAKSDPYALIESYLAEALVLLELQDWEITVSREAADITAHADIEVHDQRRTADLRIARDFFTQSPERQRLILAHELSHVITSRLDRVMENLEEPLGKIAYAILEPNFIDATERMVEHFARLIARELPLPNFGR
jgi:hypothetical protein